MADSEKFSVPSSVSSVSSVVKTNAMQPGKTSSSSKGVNVALLFVAALVWSLAGLMLAKELVGIWKRKPAIPEAQRLAQAALVWEAGRALPHAGPSLLAGGGHSAADSWRASSDNDTLDRVSLGAAQHTSNL